jgi:hypothetical protein
MRDAPDSETHDVHFLHEVIQQEGYKAATPVQLSILDDALHPTRSLKCNHMNILIGQIGPGLGGALIVDTGSDRSLRSLVPSPCLATSFRGCQGRACRDT